MIKSKGVLTISIISLFAVESAYAAIASSGYVDQQVGTKISEVHATTVANDKTANVVTSISADGNTVTATKGITAEETKNKVSTIRTDGTATDTAYPSEKAVEKALDAKQDKIEKVNTIRTDGTATDTAYPSEKAVATALDAKQDKLEGEVLTNTATGSASFSTGGADPVTNNTAIAIGPDSRVSEDDSIAIGHNAAAKASSAIVIGNGAQVVGKGAIQLGYGVNELPYTFSVGLNGQNYTLLDEAGMIPLERLGFADTKFVIDTSTISSSHSIFGGTIEGAGALTALAIGDYAQASGAGSIAVGAEAQASDTDSIAVGTNAQASGSRAVGLGKDATANADGSIQLGKGTNSEANTFSVGLGSNYKLLGSDGKIPAERLPFTGDVLTNTATGSGSVSTGGADPVTTGNAIAIGDLASAQNGGISLGSASGALSGGVSVGTQSSASNQAVVIGAESSASGLSSIAIGSFASADADYAIQLGKGDNSEANTFSVGLSDTANYTLLGSDGKIPAERLPFTGNVLTNTATGNAATAINADDAAGVSSVALGNGASVGQNGAGGTAIGPEATVEAAAGTALGATSKVTAEYAIQLGYGTNSEANTFSVGLSDTANYKLLGADGKIPVERLPNGILTNTAAAGGFSTIPAAPAASMSVALGANALTRGNNAVAVGSNVQAAQDALAIGLGANAGNASIALGVGASAPMGGVAIGVTSNAESGATAVGTSAKANATGSIQLGDGTNSEASTLSVGFGSEKNYKLLGSDGKIPAERLPFTGDVLTNTATGSDSFSTGGANVASADGAVAIGSAANAGNTSIALGQGADASIGSGVAIGVSSFAGGGAMAVGTHATANGTSSIVMGNGASATGNGNGSVAIGSGVSTTGMNAVALGTAAQSGGEFSVAVGSRAAATANNAIQIGRGTNSDANTLSVGLSDANNYKLLGSDGKIPAERLPVARIPVGSETATSYASIWVE